QQQLLGRPQFSCSDKRFPPSAQGPSEELARRNIDEAMKVAWLKRTGFGAEAGEKEYIQDVQEKVAAQAVLEDGSPAPAPSKLTANTYGEATDNGVRQLGAILGLGGGVGSDVVFADLGCGVGKVVMQMYLEFPRVRKARGVELQGSRAAKGQLAFLEMRENGKALALRRASYFAAALEAAPEPGLGSRAFNDTLDVSMGPGDMYKMDVSDLTHAYTNSLSFCDNMLRVLADKLSKEAGKLEVVITLKKFPHGLAGFSHSTDAAQMSWSKQSHGQNVHIYRRNPA
ncbi:unnamed protein product, partial [Polarella glacialis]